MSCYAPDCKFACFALDHHCGVGASQSQCVHLSRAVGRAAGGAVLSQPLGGAGDRVGQHHGLPDRRAGPLRLRPGPKQPPTRQAL